MISKLQLGEFYGATRKHVDAAAFAFAEVEDFANSRIPKHTHENAHFLYVVRGEYEASVRGKKRHCRASTMLYYPAGTTHSDHFYSAGGKFLTISLTLEANRRMLGEMNFSEYPLDFKDGEISRLGKRICRELQSPDSLSAVVLEAMANELLVFAARNFVEPDSPPGWLKRAHELLSDRCSEKVSVAEVAATVGVHPLHLARTFRRFFNCSPGEYLRERRIQLASSLLLGSKKTPAEIALISGFADQSQFTRSFKQHTGDTPANFRRANKT
ncbi:MAG TPA: AraC family transcriptional regulator [Pyrinomonadaceae bacterium]|nr:AraC family transcriptional regulator [Pyrinomonadaceae bacterium]